MNTKLNPKNSVFVVFLILFLAGFGFLSAEELGCRTVSASEFFPALELSAEDGKAVVLDIRTPGEYDRGHAPGSVNIDFYDRGFADALETLDKNGEYFMYCNSGNRSGQALRMMKNMGFKNVYDLAGGWSRNGLALSQIEVE